MIVKNIKLTLLRCDDKHGKAKETGNPYQFYSVSATDEEARVYSFNLGDELVKELGDEGLKKLIDTRVEPIEVDLELFPRTIGKVIAVSGVITKIY